MSTEEIINGITDFQSQFTDKQLFTSTPADIGVILRSRLQITPSNEACKDERFCFEVNNKEQYVSVIIGLGSSLAEDEINRIADKQLRDANINADRSFFIRPSLHE